MNQLTLDELRNWQKAGKQFLLIDVREPYEHEAWNIGGQLLPFSSFMQQANDLPADGPIVLYCRKGVRSQILIQRLAARRDVSNYYNLQGGIGDGPTTI